MPKPTPSAAGRRPVIFSSRNMWEDLIDRARVLAAMEHTTIEDVINRAVERGLPPLEAAAKRGRERSTT